MRRPILAAVALTVAVLACHTGVDDDTPCPGGTCGFLDQRYDSTFYCPPQPFVPGGWVGYSWRSNARCHDECATAAAWGCYASGCDAGCDVDHGTGQWLACDGTNGGQVSVRGCFLPGSGVNGETVSCVCH